MLIFYYINVTVHVVSACIWAGGLATVAVTGYDAGTWRLFRPWAWLSLMTSVLTGLLNLFARGYRWEDVWDGEVWQGSFGETLAVKSLLVLMAATILGAMETRWMSNRRVVGIRSLLVISVLVVVCAVFLIRGRPW